MSGYPYGGHPQYPSPQNPIYPQIYNTNNTPVPGQPSAPGYPAPGQYVPQPGFAYPYPQPGSGQASHPVAMSYPGIAPTAPLPSGPPYGYPGVTTGTPGYPGVTNVSYPGLAAGVSVTSTTVEWVPATTSSATSLTNRAVVAGYEGHDGSPLWVIRARLEGELIPGKLAIKHHGAYIPWDGKENVVHSFEVCCARPETIRWIEARNGLIPPNAVAAGNTSNGEPLYIGRAKHQGSLTPGKVHPSHKCLYISYGGQEIPHHSYEVLCTV
ncbi:uncharacterized protein LOC113229255 [Hyposmocoma kahamanoa]|uniref:uncharacterized protein LOC113229255 n=1 Tax=Hyposmocoma kahamanoa TaxID=1477025 RepID=UPI000E6DA078|nr:uncharacterized protein LOC113229255 [Hyposmocoma kahamanoa]